MSIKNPILINSSRSFKGPKDGKTSTNREGNVKTSGLGNFRYKLFTEILKNAADLITGTRRRD